MTDFPKYVVFDYEGDAECIVFSPRVTHADVAKNLKVISAGFCCFGIDQNGDKKITCWGESVSLGVQSNPDDSKLLTKLVDF